MTHKNAVKSGFRTIRAEISKDGMETVTMLLIGKMMVMLLNIVLIVKEN